MRYDLCFTNSGPRLSKKDPTLGIYSGILALYLQCHASTTGGSRNTTRKKIILYALSALYILSVTSFGLNLLLFIVSNGLLFFLKKKKGFVLICGAGL